MSLALNLSHLVPELYSRPQEDELFLYKADSLDSVFCVVSNIIPQLSWAAQERPWVIYMNMGAAVCQQTFLTETVVGTLGPQKETVDSTRPWSQAGSLESCRLQEPSLA